MNILITGASGSVGYYLIDYLHAHVLDTKLYGIGRRDLRVKTKGQIARYYHANLNFAVVPMLQQILGDVRPDVIFHLAGDAIVRPSFDEPCRYLDNNIQGTAKLYEAIRRSGLKPRVVLASTSEVYGDVREDDNPIKETQPFAPINPYAISKCAQEHLAQYYFKAHEIDTIVTRAFGYINPLRSDLVATAIMRQIAEAEKGGNRVVRHGNLKPVRTFCDVRDIVEAYWLAAQNGRPGEAYNLGSELGISIEQLLTACICDARTEITCQKDESLYRPHDVQMCIPDCSKFKMLTGWKPKIPLTESLSWLMEGMGL